MKGFPQQFPLITCESYVTMASDRVSGSNETKTYGKGGAVREC